MSMIGTAYRAALGRAASSLRTRQGFKNRAELERATGLRAFAAARVEGQKEIEKGLSLTSVADYCEAIGVSLGELFTLADHLAAETIIRPEEGLDV